MTYVPREIKQCRQHLRRQIARHKLYPTKCFVLWERIERLCRSLANERLELMKVFWRNDGLYRSPLNIVLWLIHSSEHS